MHTPDFATLTAELRDLGGRRVWSLMISLFGDLAQKEGQAIDGPLLHAIMAALQVKPEAARVALHRLRNDGWITSQKSGRISQHRLSAKGFAESAAASPRIYADPTLTHNDWQLVITQEATSEQVEAMIRLGFTALMSRVFVGPQNAVAPFNVLSLPATQAPDWLRDQIIPNDINDGYVAFLETLRALHENLRDTATATPLQIAALRCLIVHNWRRLVLKHPALPAPLIDTAGPAHQCHLLVVALLNRFARPKLSEIAPQSATA